MDKTDVKGLLSRMADIGRVSETDARDMVNEIYSDGVVSRAEAEAMFDLNDRIAGTDAHWDARFREAIKDFLLTVEAPIGWVDAGECDWLMGQLTRDGRAVRPGEVDLLLDVLRHAEGAPARLGQFAIDAACDHAAAQGKILAEDVERIRRALYAPAGDGAIWVTRREAAALFKLNDACAFAKNDASWNDLFARAIANHLTASAHPSPDTEAKALAREAWLAEPSGGIGAFLSKMGTSLQAGNWFENVTYDPGRAAAARRAARTAAAKAAETVDPCEQAWLTQRLGWDKSISPAERALVDFMKKEIPGFTNGIAATMVGAA